MRKTISLNEGWDFQKQGETMPVDLPHCWNAVDGQEGADYYRGECIYTRPLPETSGITYLEIGAANSVASVSVNGKLAGTHKGGYSLFRFDLTSYLNAGGPNSVTIAVDNSDFEDVYPSNADFTFYGGLYRGVNLITGLDQCHFSLKAGLCGVYADASVRGNTGVLHIEPHIEGDRSGVTAIYSILNREGEAVAEREAEAGEELTIELAAPILWDGLENPYLYTVRAALLCGGEEIDAVATRVGFRTISFDSEKGCFLNGKQIKLKGVSRHQDRYHMGNALTEKEHREDLALIREVGANSIRLAHYQQDQRFYDACDEMGFLVWAEVPVISHFVDAKFENAKQQLTELITQNKSHPCIYCWGVQNEITMSGKTKSLEQGIRALNDLAHRLDPTRPSTSAQVMMCGISSPMNRITDLQGYNLYFGWYVQTYHAIDQWLDQFHKAYPGIKLCLSEYGAEGIVKYQAEQGVQGDYSESYQARFHEHYARAIAEREWLWGSYVWNMFDFGAANRDEGGVKGRNNKGLVTIDRKTRKDSFYVYKAFWSDEPFVHIGGERYVDRVIGETTVPVYSNLPEVTLTVNGERITKPCDRVVYFENIPVAAGEAVITAEAGGCTHAIRIHGVAEENPAYKMQGDSGSFVKNWFVNTDGKRNTDYFSIDDRVGALLKSKDVQSLIRMGLGSRKVPSILFTIAKPFRVRTLLKLIKLEDGMKEIADQYLQTIHK